MTHTPGAVVRRDVAGSDPRARGGDPRARGGDPRAPGSELRARGADLSRWMAQATTLGPPVPGMTLLDARDHHRGALRALHRRAHRRVLSMTVSPSALSALRRRAVVAGSGHRLWTEEVVGLPATPFTLGVLARTLGPDGVRVAEVPCSAIVLDRDAVLLPGCPHPSGSPTLWAVTSPAVVVRCLELVEDVRAASRPAGTRLPVPAMTHRHIDVAVLVAAGHTDASSARRLGVSVRTVASDVARLFGVLGVRSRAEIAASVGLLGPAQDLLVSPGHRGDAGPEAGPGSGR